MPKRIFQYWRKYFGFANVLLKYNTEKLLLYCNLDLSIELKLKTIALFGPIYNLLELELKEIKLQLKEKLALSL